MKIDDKVQVKKDWTLPETYSYLFSIIEDFKDEQLVLQYINDNDRTCQLKNKYFIGEETSSIFYYTFPLSIFEPTQSKTQRYIIEECDHIQKELLYKNRKYGDSAVNPVRIFSKSDNLEQIRVRLDDKINRLINQQDDEDEDVLFDLIGYLVLYRVAKRIQEES